MSRPNIWTKTDAEREAFLNAKELVIKSLKEGSYTFNELSKMSGIKAHNIGSLVQNLRRVYNMEMVKGDDKKNYYHITSKIEKPAADTLFETMPIHTLGKEVYKGDLLTWHLRNQIYNVDTSAELRAIANLNGIRVYELDINGGRRYL